MNPSEPVNPELEPTQEASVETSSEAPVHPDAPAEITPASEVNAPATPARKIVGYCRECGNALDETNVYRALGTIYCEHHSPVERTSEQIPMDPARQASLPPPLPYTAPTYHASQPPFPSSSPLNAGGSPGLAFVLGMIPGVGAVYNGQYGKGLIHVLIFGLAISLAHGGPSDFEPLFGLLIMCFWFYMAFEAYHTAKKRQAGLPLDEFSSVFPLQGRAAHVPVGPIVLIALGTLFLLSNLEIIDMRRLLRFWPALLIVMGVYMIYTRVTVGAEGRRDGR